MKTKFFVIVFTVLALVITLGWNTSAARAATSCNSAFVTLSGSVITVKPTGVDDTVNIQCAFDAAVASGPGVDVRLKSGTFHTAQIVVNNFHGKFTGAGAKNTVIFNLPNLYVTPVDMYLNLPSADNPWPSLFSFINGDFAIADMAIHISGDNGTTGWTIFGIDPPIIELAIAVAVLGTNANVRVDRILIEGELMENSLNGYNLINGVYFEGFQGDLPWPSISGSFQVYDSTFSRIASATPVFNLSGASVTISRNRFENVFDAVDSADLVNSSLTFTNNQVKDTFLGLWFYTNFTEDSGSSFLVQNNVFSGYNTVIGGSYGPLFDGLFGEGNTCLFQGNNVQNVSDIGIYLGTGIHGCTVVGGSNKTNVLDLGIDNILVGVNNMGTGVGPDIQPFMKLFK